MPAIGGSQGDVLVIGGGPAGLAAAIALRLRGFPVTLADARRPPIDKPCGEGILPQGVEALRRLGVWLSAADGIPFRGIRFLEGSDSMDAAFRNAPGIGLRRTRLHHLLSDRAVELGVQLCWGTNARELSGTQFRWRVGADGQQSSVRREAGLDSAQMLSARFGFSRHYRLAPWSDMVEVYWGKRCQLYVTPVGPEEIGVALLTRDPGLRLDTALGEVPALQRRLGSAAASCMEHGASTTTRRLHRVFQQQTVLIGDASGSVDAISGEGLSLSFLQALSLAEALEAGDLRIYQREHRRLARRPGMMAGLLLMLEKMPRLRHGVWRALAFEPSIFGRLLNTYAVRPVSG